MVDIDPAARDFIVRTALALCRAANDYAQLLRTARSFRYWSLRLDLNEPGPLDEELAPFTEPDVVALRCAIRQGRRALLDPLGDSRRKGAVLLERIASVPDLAGMTAQGTSLPPAESAGGAQPEQLTDRWSARRGGSRVKNTRLDGHDSPVTGCVMVDDASLLVTGDGREVLVWDMSLGILRAIFGGGDNSEVMAACAPPSGAWLATVQVPGGVPGRRVGRASTLRVWDLRDGGVPRVLHEGRDGDGVYGCEVSPDGRWLVSHHGQHRVSFWDVEDWKLAGVIAGQADRLFAGATGAACYAPDGSWFALASADGSIGLWDPATRERLHVLSGVRDQAVALVAPRDSSWLASRDRGGIRIWDARRGALVRTVPATGDCRGLLADPRGRWIAASFGADAVQVIPVRAGSGQLAAGRRAGGWTGRLHRGQPQPGPWRFAGVRCRTSYSGSRIVSISALEATSPNEKVSSTRYIISYWDTATGARLAGPASRPGALPRLAVDGDLRWAVTATGDMTGDSESRVEFFEPQTTAVMAEFGYGWDRIRSASVGSRWMAAGFQSGTVRLYQPDPAVPVAEAPTPAPAAAPAPASRAPAGLDGCFAPPHGRWILVWSQREGTVLDPRSGAIRSRMTGWITGIFLNKAVNGCCAAPDGSWVATADDDGSIRVWDPETAQQLARVPGETGEDFVPGGCASAGWMVTVGGDGRLRVRDRRAFLISELSGHGMGPVARACPAGPLRLAAEDESGTHVWELPGGRHLYHLPGEHGAAMLPPAGQQPDGLLVTVGPDHNVMMRDPASGQVRATIGAGPQEARRAGSRIRAVHPAGDWLAISDDHGGLAVCLMRAGELRQVSEGSGDKLTACRPSPDGSMLATVRESGGLVIWDAGRWRQLATADTQGGLADACWAPGGDRVYVAGGFGASCFDAPPPGSGPRRPELPKQALSTDGRIP